MFVVVDGITDADVSAVREHMRVSIARGVRVSDAVTDAFIEALRRGPTASPSDLWQLVVYPSFMALGNSDASWKRTAGYALEHAFERVYSAPLAAVGLRMTVRTKTQALAILAALGVNVLSVKVDLFAEGQSPAGEWLPFGIVHVKSSIAERIQDDVPASVACMQRGIASIMLTMDSKNWPPPHGDGVVWGELGGGSDRTHANQMKRAYVEEHGQFDALFSYNLRTPPSAATTRSGKRIEVLSMSGPHPDALVRFLSERWKSRRV